MKICVVSLPLLAWWMLAQSILNVDAAFVAQKVETSTGEETVEEKASETLSSTDDVTDVGQPFEQKVNAETVESSKSDPNNSDTDEKNGDATTTSTTATTTNAESAEKTQTKQQQSPAEKDEKSLAQVGPFVDLFGPKLLKLRQLDEKRMELLTTTTNEALNGKMVVGIYFSADWCGPCRKFTPELVSFYNKMNQRMGKKGDFEIVWVSRCRDLNSFQQYFTHMNWLAMPPEDAMGARGKKLAEMYKVKSIPSLVLLDELGQVITTDARNKIPQDKAGIGFPWRNPIANLYVTILPRSLRYLIKSHLLSLKEKLLQRLQALIALIPVVANR